MLDRNKQPRSRPMMKLAIPCPLCDGRQKVALPSDRWSRNPATQSTVDEDCTCENGQVTIRLDLSDVQQMIENALDDALPALLDPFNSNDQEFLRDDVHTGRLAADMLAKCKLVFDLPPAKCPGCDNAPQRCSVCDPSQDIGF